jgi:hypothetical protein
LQKIIGILFLFVIIESCSVLKKSAKVSHEFSISIQTEKVVENVRNQNISREGFFIQKADIFLSGQEGSEKLLASIKFQAPDKYLISIRSRAGIEAARIFISEDTILINDRINRNLYYGSKIYLKQKYGITTLLLPVIFGDFIANSLDQSNKAECFKGNLGLTGIINGVKINYVLDCRIAKVVRATATSSLNETAIEFSFGNFLKEQDNKVPGKIEVEDFKRMTTIEIKVKRIELKWKGTLEFIPGNNYKIMKLQ